MAQYAHLPIYNAAFELLKEFHMRIPKFSKQYKYQLGEEFIRPSMKIIRLIVETNNTRDNKRRSEILEEMIWNIESLIISLRMANELAQWGNQKSYLYLLEKTVALSKQAEGWRKSVSPK